MDSTLMAIDLKHGEFYWVRDKEAAAKHAVTIAQYVGVGRPKWWLIASESPAELSEIEPICHIARP
jgi:hypothetical protein